MERLCKEDRKDLVWAMRRALLEQINTGVLTESADASARNFIFNEATYEQLLNLCFNENREEKYLPASILEQVAVGVYENFIEEAKKKSLVKKGLEKGRKFLAHPVKVVSAEVKKGKGVVGTTGAVLKGVGKAAVKTGAGKAVLGTAALSGAGYGTAKYLKKRAEKKAAMEAVEESSQKNQSEQEA